MIPQKVKDHIEEYISQEVYVQIAIIKGKEKVSTKKAIDSILTQIILEIFQRVNLIFISLMD